MLVLHVPLHAFGTEAALVEWELFPGFKPNHTIVLHLELNAALLATKTTMSFHQAVGYYVGTPSRDRNPVERRSELMNEIDYIYW